MQKISQTISELSSTLSLMCRPVLKSWTCLVRKASSSTARISISGCVALKPTQVCWEPERFGSAWPGDCMDKWRTWMQFHAHVVHGTRSISHHGWRTQSRSQQLQLEQGKYPPSLSLVRFLYLFIYRKTISRVNWLGEWNIVPPQSCICKCWAMGFNASRPRLYHEHALLKGFETTWRAVIH